MAARKTLHVSPRPVGRIAFVTFLIAAASLGGCATNAYVSPALPDSAVAIVEVGTPKIFDGTTPLAVDEIDGADGGIAVDQFLPVSQEYRLTPGTHAFVLDAPATKGLFEASYHNQRFEVSATLQANKRYRFVGRREPLTVKAVAADLLAGDLPVHIELVDETDGGTLQYSHEVPLGMNYLDFGPQPIAAYPSNGAASSADFDQAPSPPPPPPLTYDRWLQQHGGPGAEN